MELIYVVKFLNYLANIVTLEKLFHHKIISWTSLASSAEDLYVCLIRPNFCHAYVLVVECQFTIFPKILLKPYLLSKRPNLFCSTEISVVDSYFNPIMLVLQEALCSSYLIGPNLPPIRSFLLSGRSNFFPACFLFPSHLYFPSFFLAQKFCQKNRAFSFLYLPAPQFLQRN